MCVEIVECCVVEEGVVDYEGKAATSRLAYRLGKFRVCTV